MTRRFPFPHPFGWFMVAYADDLAPGEVTAIRYWGTDLVLWRDEAGAHHLQDAYCPHLGAHLGVGGKVQGATLECPFHGWTYDGTGACTNIPYSQRENRKAKLHTYPVVERNQHGLRVAPPRRRSSPSGTCPRSPRSATRRGARCTARRYVINTVPQEMAENGVDPAHFRYVHGTDDVAEMESYETDGPLSTMLSKQSYVTPRGVTYGRIDVYNFGPGVSKVFFSGIVDAINLATTTPDRRRDHAGPVQLHRPQDGRREAHLHGGRRVRRRDQQADQGGHADLGAQGVPAGPGAGRHATARS